MDRVTAILNLITTDPLVAAAELERMAADLKNMAATLRARSDAGGMRDTCSMILRGPDGAIKHQTGDINGVTP